MKTYIITYFYLNDPSASEHLPLLTRIFLKKKKSKKIIRHFHTTGKTTFDAISKYNYFFPNSSIISIKRLPA